MDLDTTQIRKKFHQEENWEDAWKDTVAKNLLQGYPYKVHVHKATSYCNRKPWVEGVLLPDSRLTKRINNNFFSPWDKNSISWRTQAQTKCQVKLHKVPAGTSGMSSSSGYCRSTEKWEELYDLENLKYLYSVAHTLSSQLEVLTNNCLSWYTIRDQIHNKMKINHLHKHVGTLAQMQRDFPHYCTNAPHRSRGTVVCVAYRY